MSRARTESKREASWLILLASFILGLILCQTVSGEEQEEKAKSEPGKPEVANLQRPSIHQADQTAQMLPALGGELGFGSGQPIGSGIGEIVINAEEPLSTTRGQGGPNKLRPIKADLIPRIAPLQQDAAAPLRNGPAENTPPFDGRRRGILAPADVVPEPLSQGMIYDPEKRANPWNPDTGKDETVFNGGDLGKRAAVDSSWNLYDVNPQDTIGHFDTLDGRRLVTPSNQVAIYAPRFAAVRKLGGTVSSENRLKVGSMNERKVLNLSERADFSTTTKQNEGIERFQGTKRASGFRDTNRGVVSDNVIHLQGARNSFETYENLSLFRLGMHQKSEGARLGLGMQSANVWQDNLGVQVNVKGAQPVIVNDVYKVQQLVRIDSDDKQAILRVCKVASKISARPGEPVDFSIRFDNLTGRPIGNVTIVDNLVGRLEYVPDTAECSVKANFSFETNEVGSLVLRWEIIDPLAPNTGGIIRFRCRVK